MPTKFYHYWLNEVEATDEARAEDEENRIRAERELEEICQGMEGVAVEDNSGEGDVEDGDGDDDDGDGDNYNDGDDAKTKQMDVD